ncbi:hypothetical protein BD413DRAFT_604466 [Trametes elegans]|nr:hypothetical protein BD413DRAFT_604466 [Trametes elegans]
MSITERLYIRWFPEDASEPTSTRVLTTPGRHFVDLRFYLPSSPSPHLTELEWGIAGRSVGTPTHGKWIHEISSRSAHPEDETDEGDMCPHPALPGVELERGRMRRPDSGVLTEYEEAWKPVPVDHAGDRTCVWLELRRDGPARRGAIVRVGQYCQGLVRDGERVSAQRWVRTAAGVWEKVGQVGEDDIPCDAAWGAALEQGDTVERNGAVWDVNEVATA